MSNMRESLFDHFRIAERDKEMSLSLCSRTTKDHYRVYMY